ncbi:hypothetical protein HN803_05860 [candidate division WWE3 bacterium]|nr:hypothetical protein [candidate division WWE3 bacterium]MBT7350280.1 hypothetical protein [candidate division WWE3 bacterium]
MKELIVMIRKSLLTKMFVLMFALSMAFPMSSAYAADLDPCPIPDGAGFAGNVWGHLPGVCLFNLVKETASNLDIVRTIQDMILTSLIEVPVHWIFGRSVDQLHMCIITTMNEINAGCEMPPELEALAAEDDCSDLQWNPIAMAAGYSVPPPTNYRAFGTLAGVTTSMVNATYVEPPPVNLALYVKSVAGQVPILGDTAFAQTGITDNAAFVVVFSIWKLTRNVAYGMLAIFMLVIGVMIMMRKQLDPRTSVTIQNALPRIVIAVILITFSYAIGAFAISLVPALVIAALQPFVTIVDSVGDLGKLGPMILIGASVWRLLGQMGTGGISILLFEVAMIVLFGLLLWVLVRAYMAYVKIILAIILAPITFAWGAIPGNEKVTTDWFKQVGLNVIVIPAMMLFIGVAFLIAFQVQLSAFCTTFLGAGGVGIGEIGGFFNAFAGSVMVELQVPILMMSIFFFAGKLPKKLEEAILGEKKRK